MTRKLTPIQPGRAAEMAAAGRAVIVDIREPAEFHAASIGGAVSHPLSRLGRQPLSAQPGQAIVFTCRSGMRTAMNQGRLAALAGGEAYVLEGGLDAWVACGLPVA